MTQENDFYGKAFEIIIGHEGKYSADRKDKGNWTGGKVGVGILKGTKYGISAAAFPNLDIKNITISQAKEIYKKNYWDPCGCGIMKNALALLLFDFAVNSGVKTAKIYLQKSLGVDTDGIFGQQTHSALAKSEVEGVCIRYIAYRIQQNTSLKSWTDFGKGWANRAANNLLLIDGLLQDDYKKPGGCLK